MNNSLKASSDISEILPVLFRDTSLILKLNLKEDKVTPFYESEYVKEHYKDVLFNSVSYSHSIKAFVERQVCEEERSIISAVISISNIREALHNKDTFSVIYKNTFTKNGIYSVIQFSKTVSSPEPEEVLIVFKNYDEEIQKQFAYRKNLNAARQDAEIAQMSKSTFLFNMSHDLRTPMNAIMGLTEIAKKHITDSSRVYECLEKIGFASDSLLNLLNDILDMTRLSSGKIKSHPESANLKLIISHLLDMIKPTAEIEGKSIICNYEDVIHTNIKIDTFHFTQILMNLIDNAIKYSDAKSTIYLDITENQTTDEENAYFTIKVRNTGIGINSDFLPKIFEPFTRQRNSTISGIQGTGLGLSITKKLVELLNGMIEVESEPGKETVFTLKFNFKINEKNKVEKNLSEIKKEIRHKTDLSKFKVLLVEDNELNREIAKDILSDYNIRVTEAENGSVAVNILQHSLPGEYNAVIMDIQMPVMDGYTATKKIRENENFSADKLPIIALTANTFEEDKNNCFAVGMNDHISKPVSGKTLIETLKKYCN